MKRVIGYKVYVRGMLSGFFQGAFISFLFYQSVFLALVFGLGYGGFQMFQERKRYCRRQEQEMSLEFREGLQGISSALRAGYSMENAVHEARIELEMLYGKEALLAQEFLWMEKQMDLNQSVEQLFFEMAERWNTEDINYFAQVFQTAKRTGGDLIAITRSTAGKISEKIEVQRDSDIDCREKNGSENNEPDSSWDDFVFLALFTGIFGLSLSGLRQDCYDRSACTVSYGILLE
ncbi:MAG: hypothetical protein LUH14_09375 [Clostridiaceae bacterium]|nr:hypothetical protein [Clostridiaceae bacterium]